MVKIGSDRVGSDDWRVLTYIVKCNVYNTSQRSHKAENTLHLVSRRILSNVTYITLHSVLIRLKIRYIWRHDVFIVCHNIYVKCNVYNASQRSHEAENTLHCRIYCISEPAPDPSRSEPTYGSDRLESDPIR
jgi:hypothetical protein